jgi:hypothetical protein
MEGVLYSDTNVEKTIDYIELLLEENCRNIWVWTIESIYEELLHDNVWEKNVHISHNSHITSIGDCLRELYTRDQSRDNLIIIGNTNVNVSKLIIHKNFNKKHVGVLLFGDGDVSIDIRGGTIHKYQMCPLGDDKNTKKGLIMEIAYCTLHILSIFQDNFDCNTFHDLILSNPIGYSFGAVMDKRLNLKDMYATISSIVETSSNDFLEELTEMCLDIKELNENSKLELNSLRLAYGLPYKKLIESLKNLNRHDLT